MNAPKPGSFFFLVEGCDPCFDSNVKDLLLDGSNPKEIGQRGSRSNLESVVLKDIRTLCSFCGVLSYFYKLLCIIAFKFVYS